MDCGDPDLLDPVCRVAERARARASSPDEIPGMALMLIQDDRDEWEEFYDSQTHAGPVVALIERLFRDRVSDYIEETQ